MSARTCRERNLPSLPLLEQIVDGAALLDAARGQVEDRLHRRVHRKDERVILRKSYAQLSQLRLGFYRPYSALFSSELLQPLYVVGVHPEKSPDHALEAVHDEAALLQTIEALADRAEHSLVRVVVHPLDKVDEVLIAGLRLANVVDLVPLNRAFRLTLYSIVIKLRLLT